MVKQIKWLKMTISTSKVEYWPGDWTQIIFWRRLRLKIKIREETKIHREEIIFKYRELYSFLTFSVLRPVDRWWHEPPHSWLLHKTQKLHELFRCLASIFMQIKEFITLQSNFHLSGYLRQLQTVQRTSLTLTQKHKYACSGLSTRTQTDWTLKASLLNYS